MMKMMKSQRYSLKTMKSLRYSFKTMKSRDSVLILLILCIGMCCLAQGIEKSVLLAGDLQKPALIRCQMPEEANAPWFEDDQSVQGVYRYYERQLTIAYGDYAGEVSVVGLQKECFEDMLSDYTVMSSEQTMPYVVMGTSALKLMKDNKGKALEQMSSELPLTEALLMETMDVMPDSGAESFGTLRICGMFEDGESPFSSENIYMTESAYLDLMGHSDEKEDVSSEDRTSLEYVIVLKNSWNIDSVMESAEKEGIVISPKSDMPEKSAQWQTLRENIGRKLLLFMMSALCGGLLMYDQWKLWLMNNHAFAQYVKMGTRKTDVLRGICRGRILLYAAFGILGGCLIYGIGSLF